MSAWLSVIGIGEDGLAGLAPAVRALVESAEVLVGGARHLALVPAGDARRIAWEKPLGATLTRIEAERGRRVVVLASGDPLCYGVGAMLARRFAPSEMIVLPRPSAFSLAAARLIWPLADCVTLTLHGRPLERLRLHLAPGARLLALSADGETPGRVAALLRDDGWGPSQVTVLEHLGGPRERRVDGTAAAWPHPRAADLNVVAIECRPGPEARILSRVAGLPDDAFRHDGQITKRVVRAATLALLAPLPDERLWDVGAGCGSIAIEWLRAEPRARAVAIERDPARSALVAENATSLGVPELAVVAEAAPAALAGLEPPDAIFLGGSVGDETLWQAAWQALKPGGRLVANAVTLDGEAALLRRHALLGGTLARIAVASSESLGSHDALRPHRAVTQLCIIKPAT